jgi:hypothetical protein
MVDDTARDRAIYHALKASDEVAAALQTHLIEEHGADPERAAPQSPSTNSLKLLRQARERLGAGLRAVQADHIAESDEISLRNQHPRQHTANVRHASDEDAGTGSLSPRKPTVIIVAWPGSPAWCSRHAPS